MKTDIYVKNMFKRLDNLLSGSSPSVSKWDVSGFNSGPNGPTTNNNWDMINKTIEDHEGDSWYIPKEDVYNAWTCLVGLTLGNIELRDFALERKFADMRHARVEEYNRKWEEARDRGDTDYTSKHASAAFANTASENWSEEEIDYYSNLDRFPPTQGMTPEERYAHGKKHWYQHPSSWGVRVPHKGYDGQGCTGKACVPECRFYHKTGRIEDAEVIQEHRKLEQSYRDKNAIVEPPHPSEYYYHRQG
jgi:hypothetical protein